MTSLLAHTKLGEKIQLNISWLGTNNTDCERSEKRGLPGLSLQENRKQGSEVPSACLLPASCSQQSECWAEWWGGKPLIGNSGSLDLGKGWPWSWLLVTRERQPCQGQPHLSWSTVGYNLTWEKKAVEPCPPSSVRKKTASTLCVLCKTPSPRPPHAFFLSPSHTKQKLKLFLDSDGKWTWKINMLIVFVSYFLFGERERGFLLTKYGTQISHKLLCAGKDTIKRNKRKKLIVLFLAPLVIQGGWECSFPPPGK